MANALVAVSSAEAVIPVEKGEALATPPKLPKAVAALREKLGGEKPTVDNMKKVLGCKAYNNFANNFRASLQTADKDKYATLSASEKADWIEAWALDFAQCKMKGFNRITAESSSVTKIQRSGSPRAKWEAHST